MEQRIHIPVKVDPAFASMKDVSEYLNISLRMAYKLAENEKIPAVRFGAIWRVPWSWLKEKAGVAL